MSVTALYVDPRGPYPTLVDDWFDEARDARKYEGDDPVVAHPPCGPWANLKHLCRQKQTAQLAWYALADVMRCGGVLEHPRYSKFWAEAELPAPGGPITSKGFTLEVAQCDWGHPARKWTWLYVHGFSGELPARPPHREPTHWCSGGRTTPGHTHAPTGIKICSAQQRRRTPVEFAKWLIQIASQCRGEP